MCEIHMKIIETQDICVTFTQKNGVVSLRKRGKKV